MGGGSNYVRTMKKHKMYIICLIMGIYMKLEIKLIYNLLPNDALLYYRCEWLCKYSVSEPGDMCGRDQQLPVYLQGWLGRKSL